MGVTHGKKKDHNLQSFPRAHTNSPGAVSSSCSQMNQDRQEAGRKGEQQGGLCRQPPSPSSPPQPPQREGDSAPLVRPKKPLHPTNDLKSHQELHKELRMTHKRGLCQDGKTELQRMMEKRNWEQRVKARRDQEVAERSQSQLHQELLKRHQRLDKLERGKEQQQESPEFLLIKQRLRRTTALDVGENNA